MAPEPAPGFFFGGMPLPLHVLGRENPMYRLPVTQRELERVLDERAAELGADVRRGWEVLYLSRTESASPASATTTSSSGGP